MIENDFTVHNLIFGSDDDDVLVGTTKNDSLDGGEGNDKLYGGAGNDRLIGDYDDDQLFGDAGNDVLWGDIGNDVLKGGTGHDRMYGGFDNDTLIGGKGDDYLDGGFGNDRLIGNGGADTLLSSSGKNLLNGGPGNDHYILGISATEHIAKISDNAGKNKISFIDHTYIDELWFRKVNEQDLQIHRFDKLLGWSNNKVLISNWFQSNDTYPIEKFSARSHHTEGAYKELRATQVQALVDAMAAFEEANPATTTKLRSMPESLIPTLTAAWQ